jgi:hypothetical protein
VSSVPRHLTARRRVAATASLLLVLAVGFAAPAAAADYARSSSGFGATVASWVRAHPEDKSGCPAATCFGPKITGSGWEFSFVSTTKGRVVGWDQALPRGTSVLRAQLEVAELFPADATMGSLTIVHRDAYGSACAFFDIHSKTVQHQFGNAAFGGSQGTIGVELATLMPNGSTTYNPANLDLAIVIPTYVGSNDNC